jgi:DNA-binding SARP family transcriptional activator
MTELLAGAKIRSRCWQSDGKRMEKQGVHVHLLGRLGVEHGERWLDGSQLPGSQGRLVLAYLALAHGPVPRSELGDAVWSDVLPKSWERDLSSVVSKVRASLAALGAGDVLSAGMGCYELQLPTASRIDVHDCFCFLEDADAAVLAGDLDRAIPAADTAGNLARRMFLPGDDAPWVDRRRAELRDVLLHSLDIMIDGQLQRGFTRDALRLANEAIALEPFRETSYVHLMTVQAATGNRAEALRTYERCRELLTSELGIGPSPETEAAYLRILGATTSS